MQIENSQNSDPLEKLKQGAINFQKIVNTQRQPVSKKQTQSFLKLIKDSLESVSIPDENDFQNEIKAARYELNVAGRLLRKTAKSLDRPSKLNHSIDATLPHLNLALTMATLRNDPGNTFKDAYKKYSPVLRAEVSAIKILQSGNANETDSNYSRLENDKSK
jgi:hypothetical protein